MENFKRIMAALLLIALMFVTLSGCGKHGKCEGCGQTESLNKFEEYDGDVRWYCDTCYQMAKVFS